MKISIDWVSVGILFAGGVVSQVRMLPLSVRNGVLAVSFGAIAIYRLRMGAHWPNLGYVVATGILSVIYLTRAFSTKRGTSRGSSE